jgi:hydroxymethylpyrimidine kinase/phosphomethylpyrimidine kinase
LGHCDHYTALVSKQKNIPVVLTIAGSDSGGGAGIQADLKTFAALDVHGTSAITCITAQNPNGVYAIEMCSPAIVRKQIEAVFDELAPKAVKIGMLYSKQIIAAVADFFSNFAHPPLVIDPVMVSTSGNPLLKPDAANLLCKKLFPKATLITPNIDEAEILTGQAIHSVEDLRSAAKLLHHRFGCAALVKGGHLRKAKDAVDAFYNGNRDQLLSRSFIRAIRTHGTGCTYSAAIAAYLAHGFPLLKAVKNAKHYVTQSIAQSKRANGHWVLKAHSSTKPCQAPFFAKKLSDLPRKSV